MSSAARSTASGVVAWGAVVAGSLLLAALVAPLVQLGISLALPAAELPFARVFNRVAMLAAVGMLVAFRRSVGWEEVAVLLRHGTRGERSAEVGAGFLAGLAGCALGIGWAVAVGELGPPPHEYRLFVQRTATTLIGGLVAAALEESFFRGMMFARLARSLGWKIAALASSAVYSAVHLLISDPTVRWNGYAPGFGLGYLFRAVSRQLEPASFAVLLGLFVLGLVSCAVVRRAGSLYVVIGLHAGWIFCFQNARHATAPRIPIPGVSLLATRQFLVGRPWAWSALILSGLLALAWLAWRQWRRRDDTGAV